MSPPKPMAYCGYPLAFGGVTPSIVRRLITARDRAPASLALCLVWEVEKENVSALAKLERTKQAGSVRCRRNG